MPAEKRKGTSKSKKQNEVKEGKRKETPAKVEGSGATGLNNQPDSHYNPKRRSTVSRLLIRLTTIVGLLLAAHVYFGSVDPFKPFAKQDDVVSARFVHMKCSDDFREDRKKFPECAPSRCGRSVMDKIVTADEAKQLLGMAKRGLALGGSNGGASILDLHSGALSKGDSFINIYKYLESKNIKDFFSSEEIRLYRRIADRIKVAISAQFQIAQHKLYLTHPTFFSRMNNKQARTVHDEYWHPHVDKQTYSTFDYTSLLYLTDYGVDFEGGRFVFVDKSDNYTIEPKLARVSFFTSGSENLHYVEKVTTGTRYAITVSFTCDREKSIKYPSMGS